MCSQRTDAEHFSCTEFELTTAQIHSDLFYEQLLFTHKMDLNEFEQL